MNAVPILSVCVITYNHDKLISECLESILNQKTDFPFEIVIGEDNSKDKTYDLCKDFVEKHFKKARLLGSSKNLGMYENFNRTLSACEGKYIALCEGDDYWIDDFKLQKQVDYLEANEDCAGCFHDVLIEKNGSFFRNNHSVSKTTLRLEDLSEFNRIQTNSFVFRNVVNLPRFLETSPLIDWPLQLLVAKHGYIKYFEDIMGVYRIHEGGVFSGLSDFTAEKQKNINSRYLTMLDNLQGVVENRIAIKNLRRRKFLKTIELYHNFQSLNDWKGIRSTTTSIITSIHFWSINLRKRVSILYYFILSLYRSVFHYK